MRDAIRRAGQRLLVGFDGYEASGDVKRLIRQFGAGGIILFGRNVASPEQVAELVRELQAVAVAAGHDQPLVVCVDQEGGRVQRLKQPWTEWPPLRFLGETGSVDFARSMGQSLASELGSAGIRLNLAPVVDVDTNPSNPVIGDRSLGGDADLVARLAAAFVGGIQAGGVAACAKHFPGHGDTDRDSHLSLPSVEHDLARLEAVELVPFRAAVLAGVAAVMTAHIVVRSVDDAVPATLSRRVVTGLLRERLGFPGVIVTDDLEMGAVRDHWRAGEAAVCAAAAGCDLVCVCHTADLQVEALESLVRAEESGELEFADGTSALARIRELKATWVVPYGSPDPRAARDAASGSEGHRLAALVAASRGALA